MQTRQILVSRQPTYVREQGQGTPLLILHGWGVSSREWQEAIDYLSEEKYRVIALDLPGFGQSALPPFAWQIGDYANWLTQVLQELAIDRFILLGHSFGGRVAIKYAAAHPERLDALILTGAAGLKTRNIFKKIKKSIFRGLAKTGKRLLGSGNLAICFKKLLYKASREHDYEQAVAVMQEVLAKAVAEDLSDFLPAISTPTLLIWGEKDSYTPLQDGYRMNQLLPNSLLTVISQAKHNLYRVQAREFCSLVTEYLSKIMNKTTC